MPGCVTKMAVRRLQVTGPSSRSKRDLRVVNATELAYSSRSGNGFYMFCTYSVTLARTEVSLESITPFCGQHMHSTQGFSWSHDSFRRLLNLLQKFKRDKMTTIRQGKKVIGCRVIWLKRKIHANLCCIAKIRETVYV